MVTATTRLKQKGIVLSRSTPPMGIYVTTIRSGRRLLFSGTGPWVDGKPTTGTLGDDMSIRQGHNAAYEVGLGVLASIQETGLLDRVRLIKAFGMVKCTAGFEEQPAVINGFSQLMVDVFGPESGKGVRSAVGFIALPKGIAVEIEGEFEIKPLWLWERLKAGLETFFNRPPDSTTAY